MAPGLAPARKQRGPPTGIMPGQRPFLLYTPWDSNPEPANKRASTRVRQTRLRPSTWGSVRVIARLVRFCLAASGGFVGSGVGWIVGVQGQGPDAYSGVVEHDDGAVVEVGFDGGKVRDQ